MGALKFSTDAVDPSRAASSSLGCFFPRLALMGRGVEKSAMLRASSSWLRARAATSSRRVGPVQELRPLGF